MPLHTSQIRFIPTDATASFQADTEGAIYYDDSDSQLKHYDGFTWGAVNTNVWTPTSIQTQSTGKYSLSIAGHLFDTWVITRYAEGPYVKILQMNNDVDLSGTGWVNQNGTWADGEVTAYSGKLHTDIINSLTDNTNKFCFRVTGQGDALNNDGAGTSGWIMNDSSALARWGTGNRPSSYKIQHDITSDGTWDYYWDYTDDNRGDCYSDPRHWYHDHNYFGSGALPSGASEAICYDFKPDMLQSNLHWLGYPAGSSGGNIQTGDGSGEGLALFILWT